MLLWIQFRQSIEFTTLHFNLKKALKVLNPIEETRNPIPHITLARVKQKIEINQYSLSTMPQLTVNKIEFMGIVYT